MPLLNSTTDRMTAGMLQNSVFYDMICLHNIPVATVDLYSELLVLYQPVLGVWNIGWRWCCSSTCVLNYIIKWLEGL